MAKSTHITATTISSTLRQSSRIRTMCGAHTLWINTYDAAHIENGGEISKYAAPLCPKCAALVLISSTVGV